MSGKIGITRNTEIEWIINLKIMGFPTR